MPIEIIDAPRTPQAPTAQLYLDTGSAAHRAGNLDAAIEFYTTALRIDPECVGALTNLSSILSTRKHLMAAVACARRAIAMTPDNPFLLANLASILVRMEHYEAAIQVLERAIELDGSQRGFWHTLGLAYMPTDPARAIECLERSSRLGDPKDTHPIRDLALAQFALGRWREGLENFSRDTNNGSHLIWKSGIPEWKGEDLDGRRLLIHHEQGFGDTIQFCRYLRHIRGGWLILSVPAPLVRLLEGTSLVDEVVCSLDPPPAADFQAPLMAALRFVGFEDRILEPVEAYLSAPAHGPRVKRGPQTTLAVGVCWSGSANYVFQQRRAIPFEDFLSIADIPTVQLYSLQKLAPAEDARKAGADALVPDLSGLIGDFADMAHVINQLDLVVSVDTAVLHLAGALGKPAIGLMRYNGCWRWGVKSDVTPFYPTMRLVRQEAPGDWVGVMIRVRRMIAEILEA